MVIIYKGKVTTPRCSSAPFCAELNTQFCNFTWHGQKSHSRTKLFGFWWFGEKSSHDEFIFRGAATVAACGAVHLDRRQQQCSATLFCKAAAGPSILFNLFLQFPEFSLCQHHCRFDRWSPACEASSLCLLETPHLPAHPPLRHRYVAQWVAVAVAPIMNSLLHLNTRVFPLH